MDRRILEKLRHPALQGRWVASIDGFLPEELIIESIAGNPIYKTGETSRFYQGRMMGFPDVASVDSIQIAFYETHTFDTSDFFYRWSLKKFDPKTGVYGLPKDYMKNLTARLFPVNSSTKPSAALKFTRIWPVDNQAFDLSYVNAEGRLVFQVTMAVQDAYLEML